VKPITPETRRYTTWWNINVRKLACPVRWDAVLLKDELARDLMYGRQRLLWQKSTNLTPRSTNIKTGIQQCWHALTDSTSRVRRRCLFPLPTSFFFVAARAYHLYHWRIQTPQWGGQPSPSFPFPFSSFPFLPFPSLPLVVGPLNTARESRERCKPETWCIVGSDCCDRSPPTWLHYRRISKPVFSNVDTLTDSTSRVRRRCLFPLPTSFFFVAACACRLYQTPQLGQPSPPLPFPSPSLPLPSLSSP